MKLKNCVIGKEVILKGFDGIYEIMDIDKEDANQLNVRGTPTIFVNEKRLSVLSQKDLFDLVESEIYK